MRQHLPPGLLLPVAAVLLLLPPALRLIDGSPAIPGGVTAMPGVYGWVVQAIGPSAVLLSIALGLLSAWLFSRVVPALTRSPRLQGLLLLVWIINPIAIGLFTSLDPLTVAVPVALLCLLAKRKAVLIPLSLLLALIHPVFSLLFLALLVIKRRTLLPALLLAAALTLIQGSPFHAPALSLVEFGNAHGASLLLMALALLESGLRWPERAPIISFLILLGLAPFIDAALVLVGLMSAPLAGFFIHRLWQRRWTVKEAKPLAMLLIGCGLLFLLLTHVTMLVKAEPTAETVALLDTLPEGSIVLAPPELAPIIEGYSKAQAFLDEETCRTRVSACEAAESLYDTWKQAAADEILVRHGITHLILTDELRNRWSHDEDGLLFLLKHSEKFKKQAETTDMELWSYEARR